jgi:DNA-binding transcriptional LysR family regulator
MAATVSPMTQIPPEGAPEHVSLADYLPYQLAMDKVRVSRAAQDLVERRLAVRLSNRVDRRSHSLELTAAGRRLFAEIVPLARAYEAALLAGLAPSEVTTLKRLLGQLEVAAATLYGADTAPPGSERPE